MCFGKVTPTSGQRMALVRDRRAATAEWREGPISETGMCSDHRTRQLPEGEGGKRPTGQGLAGEEPVSCWALLSQENQVDLVHTGQLPCVPPLPASSGPCFAV